jgi:tagaturonate reductase
VFHNFFPKANRILEKCMPLLTPAGVLAGFLLGHRISGLAPAVTILFAGITFAGALNMNVRDVVGVIKKPLPIGVFLIFFHIVIPTLIYLLCSMIFAGNRDYITGFMLLFSIPTAVSGYVWTTIHKGNGPLSLSLILLDTILAPVLVPATLSFFLRTSVTIDAAGMFLSLVWMVVIPSILGIAINQKSRGEISKRVQPVAQPLSKIALVCVVGINTSRVADSVNVLSPEFLFMAAICIPMTLGVFALGSLSGKLARFGRPDRVTTMYAIGMHNISAALVLALDFFPPVVAMPIITGILFQQSLASLAGVVFVQKQATKDSSSGS